MPCRHAGDGDDGDVDPENFAKTALVLGGPRAIRTALEREGAPALPAGSAEGPGECQHDWRAGASGGCPAHEGSHASGADGDADRDRNGPHHDGSEGDAHHDRNDNDGGECPVDHAESAEGSGDRGHEHRSSHGGEKSHSDDGGPAETPPSPQYHLLLSLTLSGSPDPEERTAVEAALSGLAAELGWGFDGILFSLGYAPSYFRHVDVDLPESVRADPAFAEAAVAADGGRSRERDALLHLASDDARLLLAAEEALWGGDPVLDFELDATLSDIFERPRDPPARRPAVATGEGVAPGGDSVLAEGWVDGGAIERIARLERDGDGGAGGCPAHGDEGRTGAEADAGAATLLELGVEGSTPLAVGFGAPDPAGSDGEAYLVPPTERRSIPTGR